MPLSDMLMTKRHLLGGVALTAFAAAVVSTSGTAFGAAADVPKSDGEVEMSDVLKPGALPEMALGDPNAKVKIVEYMSTTCPHCAHFAATTFDQIKTKYIDTGKVYFAIREFPIDPQDLPAYAAFMLVRCAPNGPSIPLLETFMKQQENWARVQDVRGALLQISKLAGFTQESFEACLTNQKLVDDVNSVRDRGSKEFGVSGTPTFLINGKRYAGDMSVEAMSTIIDSML